MIEMLEGQVIAYACFVCGNPCIFLRPPNEGEECHGCWEGTSIYIREPIKEERE